MESERDLLALVLAGDAAARDRFVDEYADFVWRVAVGACGKGPDDPLTGEIVSDAFLKLMDHDWRALRQWRGTGSLESFLAVVIRNCARDHFRSQRDAPAGYRRISLDRTDAEQGGDLADRIPDAAGEETDPLCLLLQAENRAAIQSAVRKALPQLSPRDQELLERRHCLGQSYREVAAGMNLTVNNVGVSLKRAEERLAKILRMRFPEVE